MLSERELHIVAQMFQPSRLTLARELAGLTKVDVGERTEKSASAISQFEAGKIRPDTSTILRMALALGVPPGFFAHRSSSGLISMDACHFRSLRCASQRERRRLLAIGVLLRELVGGLEEFVEFPPEQITAVAQSVDSESAIEDCAVDVRRRWGYGLGPIPNVVKLLEAKGVVVWPIGGGAREVDAFSFWHDKRPFVFLLVDKGCASRTRWDAAHELGHLVMHADVLPGNPAAEQQANRFAAAFLLPRETFLPECPRRLVWDHFYELKRRWKVSLAALVKRCRDLGALSEASYRRAWISLNRLRPEPFEPPQEVPHLVAEAIDWAREEVSFEDLAARLGLGPPNLRDLLAALEDGCPADTEGRAVGGDEVGEKPDEEPVPGCG